MEFRCHIAFALDTPYSPGPINAPAWSATHQEFASSPIAAQGPVSSRPSRPKLRMGRHALHARKHIGFRWFRRDP